MDKYYLLVDIDGTLSDASNRAKTYLGGEKPDWDGFYAACGEDAPITPVIRIIEALSSAYDIVLCTGRRKSCEAATREWFARYAPSLMHAPILFRKDGDCRHDTVVKPELLEGYMKENHKKQPYAVFEGRDSMVAKWRDADTPSMPSPVTFEAWDELNVPRERPIPAHTPFKVAKDDYYSNPRLLQDPLLLYCPAKELAYRLDPEDPWDRRLIDAFDREKGKG